MSDYNAEFWHKQIQKYQQQQWAVKPSPFVQLVEGFLKPGARILELGTGAGQDGLWLMKKGYTVTLSDGDDVAFAAIQKESGTLPVLFDITRKFPFQDGVFDVVYAQLVLHYFDDATMQHIVKEIQRVLAPDGIFAAMVNSIHDSEYDSAKVDNSGLIDIDGLTKRYFSKTTFSVFTDGFSTLLSDENGRTPKDDVVGTTGMVQFIGQKL